MTKIISPINGIVDAVDVKLGQAIAPGFPAIRVINMSSLRVKAEVAESYAARIKKELMLQFIFQTSTIPFNQKLRMLLAQSIYLAEHLT